MFKKNVPLCSIITQFNLFSKILLRLRAEKVTNIVPILGLENLGTSCFLIMDGFLGDLSGELIPIVLSAIKCCI